MADGRGDAVPSAAARPPRIRAGSAFWITTGFAFLGAAAELCVWAARRWGFGEMVLFGPQLVWMAPLSYALFFLPLAVALALVGPRLGAGTARRVVLFAPAAAAVFSVLFLFYPALHRVAIVLLALGVAAELTRRLEGRFEAVVAVARRAVVIGFVLIPLLAGALRLGSHWREERALGALGPAREGAPNIVLIVLDTVRAISMSLYGYDRPTTPFLAGLARNGMLFERAYSTAPWTLPSHATLLTGRYPGATGAGWRTPLRRDVPTLAGVLDAAGYRTGGFVANLEYTSRPTGLARDFTHYEDFPSGPAEVALSSSVGRFVVQNPRLRDLVGFHDIPGRKRADRVNAEALGWIGRSRGRPFFAFLNYYDAHEPYLPPPSYVARFHATGRDESLIRTDGPRMAQRIGKQSMGPADRRLEESAYDASLAALDAGIGRLMAALRARHLLDNTIVVVTSDHGELFGEHGLFTHGNSLYAPLLHVPLLVVAPGLRPGVVNEPTSLRDVPATILSLAGLGPGRIPGVPLLGSRAGDGARWSAAFSAVEPAPNQRLDYPATRGPMRSLVRGGLHYIRDGDGGEELYDLRADAGELHDRARDPALAARLAALRAEVDSLGTAGSP